MKRILFLALMLFLAQPGYSQSYFSYAKSINGVWGDWVGSGLRIKGRFSNLYAYRNSEHPSNFIFRLETPDIEKLFDQSKEAKAMRKKHLREDKQYEFDGEMTFYGGYVFRDFINVFPDIYVGATTITDSRWGKEKVKVIIPPFKDKNGIKTINVFYQGYALAISL